MTGNRTALYLRISREDGETSQSIENQRRFLLSYADRMGYTVYDIYADDGYSGTNFDRPEFRRMLRDIEEGHLDIVITKDLSRLGRDYIGIGEYIEKYFPSKKIRYIAVNDRVDSHEGIDKMAPFMYVFNDFYPRDISDKVKAVFAHKKLSGEFIGSFAPYGYKKDPYNKGRLIIDDNAAGIVRDIFHMSLSGNSCSEIARILTEARVETPSQYSGRISSRQKYPGLWSSSMVKRILTNPTYAGHITQNRSRKLGVKLNKQVNLPPEEWIVVHNTHDPIVSQEEFNKAGELLKTKSHTAKKNVKHLLSGLVFCGDCKKPMTFQRDGGGRRYMICSTSRKRNSVSSCTSHCIREDGVERAVFKVLGELCENAISDRDIEQSISENAISNGTPGRGVADLKRKLEDMEKTKYRLYRDMAIGKIRQDEYEYFKSQAETEYNSLISELKKHENEISKAPDREGLFLILRDISLFKTPERAALIWLVDKIYINQDKSIQLYLKFEAPSGQQPV